MKLYFFLCNFYKRCKLNLDLNLFNRGRVDKCDFYGYSVLHYSVKSRNTACVLFLINYEPKLIWMMDINNNTAKHLAQTLDYTEIVSLIDKFLESQSYLILRRLYRFQIKEMKNAERRRAKYACLMKSADKHHENEYNQRQGDRILLNNQFLEKGICSDGGSRYSYYSGSEERENKMKNYNSKISNKIVLNENVTLLTLNNNSTNV